MSKIPKRCSSNKMSDKRAGPSDGSKEVTTGASLPGSCSSSSSAVVVENATKYYGKGMKKITAIDNLFMRVVYGSIYGLLGPSGCGKTTVLGCLVNRLRLDKGNIYLFGFAPGSRESAVPGGRVGYMPQELALYQEFTIVETLQYFGRIHCLHSLNIEDRTNFLVSFLDLPQTSRLIHQLSGGQQRRVSLAVALLHEPELLILDEPTVGVDPLLRASIWSHLMEVSKKSNATIIITTHYIEEARQADRVGLMRKGRLLAEDSPQSLIESSGLISLEEVFMKLCVQYGAEEDVAMESIQSNIRGKGHSQSEGNFGILREEKPKILMKPWVSLSKTNRRFSGSRIKALVIKNFTRIRRNMLFLVFSFALPSVQTILFCVTVGGLPHDLPMAVVNLDKPLPIIGTRLSEVYLNALDPYVIKQEPFETFAAGYESVDLGKTWGLIFFNVSFTAGLVPSFEGGDGTIHVYMDDTNKAISITIKMTLFQALEKAILEGLQSNPDFLNRTSSLEIPLKFEEPVYFVEDATFRDFVAPGILLTIVYFMAVGLTAFAFLIERKEGLLERSWVSGVRISEVLFSHLVTQLWVMAVQITLILVLLFPIFQVPCKGSMFWVVSMAVFQGICGMTYGLMVSGLSKDELTAIQIIMGTFYPIILLSGIVWPVEGMPTFVRYISYILPQTYACEGLRGVLYRGWGISHFDVYIGYVITILWISLYLGVSLAVVDI